VDPLGEASKVEQSMYGVARLSMGELEIENFRRRDAMAGSRQRHSGRSEIA
jgi:hypothetical protein